MSGTEQANDKKQALARVERVTRTFKVERRLEDEPAHHERALRRLAKADPER